MPPVIQSAEDSAKNCAVMSRRLAPSARRIPISRMRSVTLVSIMFIMPMPPTSSEMLATAPMMSEKAPIKELRASMALFIEVADTLSYSSSSAMPFMLRTLDSIVLQSSSMSVPSTASAVTLGNEGFSSPKRLAMVSRGIYSVREPMESLPPSMTPTICTSPLDTFMVLPSASCSLPYS